MNSQAADIADALAPNVANLTDREKRIAVVLYQMLADGDPVSTEALAERVGEPEEALAATLDEWPGVFRDDDQEHVVGFWGLAVNEMSHRFQAEGGKPMYAWCALDPFIVVPVIARTTKVNSTDPVTGAPISVIVTPEGLTDLEPESTVVTLLQPEGPLGQDVMQTFCHYVMFFASIDSAQRWAERQQLNITILTAAEAFEVGKRAWSPLTESSSR